MVAVNIPVDVDRREGGKLGMRKEPALVIHPSEFPVFLIAKIGKTPVVEFAESLGVTRQLVYMMLQGKRQPSAAVLKKLGLEVYYGLKREDPQQEKK
jgi:transcriptional regulator with XRE-family HTH domain